MTRKLEQLFDLPDSEDQAVSTAVDLPVSTQTIAALDNAIDKIDEALPAVKGLESNDSEMDELAKLAQDSYKDLMDLGMQVDSRFASEIFNVASSMLGHAITAKTAKMDKKLKMIDLQLKKMRLDQQAAQVKDREGNIEQELPTAQGMVLSRNDLLQRIIAGNKENTKKE